MSETSLHVLHISMAERGKQAALAHRHDEALRCYRDAIRMAVSGKAPEVFFRHYSQCVLESLELTGQYAEVAHFCREADAHYRGLQDVDTPLHRKDHGSLLERLGAVQLKQGETRAATQALEAAVALAGPGSLPLAEQLLGWLRRGLACGVNQVLQAQRRHHYFVVRPGSVNADLARVADRIPPQCLPAGPAPGTLAA